MIYYKMSMSIVYENIFETSETYSKDGIIAPWKSAIRVQTPCNRAACKISYQNPIKPYMVMVKFNTSL